MDTPTGWWWLLGANSAGIQDRINAGFRPFDIDRTGSGIYNAVFVANSGVYAKSNWNVYYSQTPANLVNLYNANNQRLLDLHVYDAGAGTTAISAVAISNTGSDATGWGWLYNTTPAAISNWVNTNPTALRLIDLDVYPMNGSTVYSAVAVNNTGGQFKPWAWTSSQTPAGLSTLLSNNGMRLVDIEVVDGSPLTFAAVMTQEPGNWWWYYGQTSATIDAHLNQLGARVADLEQYVDSGGNTRYAAVLVDNANAVTSRVRGLFWNALSDGDFGLYLKQVGGPTLASLNIDYVFEPASMIKILHGTYAIDRCAAGTDNLGNLLFNDDRCNPNECPDGIACNGANETLRTVLERMLENSDNNATNEIATRYGVATLNAYADNTLLLNNTQLNHTLGCLCGNPNNNFTLRDAGSLYEQIADGSLFSTTWKNELFGPGPADGIMADGDGDNSNIAPIIAAEAVGTSLTATELANFRNELNWAEKPGGYLCVTGTGARTNHKTQGGWASIPFKDGAGNIFYREYVLGTFVNNSSVDAEGNVAYTAWWELLREQIRSALLTWDAACTPPTITNQPDAANVLVGDPVQFIVGGGGTSPRTYTWYRNNVVVSNGAGPGGSTISGATSATLTISNAQIGNAGSYRVFISNGCGSVNSATVQLTVSDPPPCNPDYNNDGGADNSDVTDLANDIAAGTQSFPPNSPDFNNDGGADNTDITDLANTIASGNCP